MWVLWIKLRSSGYLDSRCLYQLSHLITLYIFFKLVFGHIKGPIHIVCVPVTFRVVLIEGLVIYITSAFGPFDFFLPAAEILRSSLSIKSDPYYFGSPFPLSY